MRAEVTGWGIPNRPRNSVEKPCDDVISRHVRYPAYAKVIARIQL
jgi:hypothetical protein